MHRKLDEAATISGARRHPFGRFFSTRRPATRGLPPQGVLSPTLWPIHSNDLPTGVEKLKSEWLAELQEVDAIAYFFADDAAFAPAHPNPGIVDRGVTFLAGTLRRCAKMRGLRLSEPKSFNLAVSPGRTVRGDFPARGVGGQSCATWVRKTG